MKKIYSKIFVFQTKSWTLLALFLVMMLVDSCTKTPMVETPEPQNSEITQEIAKSIYEKYKAAARISKTEKKRKAKESPLWDHSKKLKFNDGIVAIVTSALEDPGTENLFAIAADSTAKMTYEQVFSPLKIVIYKDKEGKEHVERLYIKANGDYAKSKNYQYDDADFTGTYWFEDYDGNFLRALAYANGKVTKVMQLRSNKPNNGRTMCGYEETLMLLAVYYQIVTAAGYVVGPVPYDTEAIFVDVVNFDDCTATPVSYPSGSGWSSGSPWYASEPGFMSWYSSLNTLEVAWLLANPDKAYQAYKNHLAGELSSWAEYGGENIKDQDGTNQNAYKHALIAALNTYFWGPTVALTIANNHEGGPNSPGLNHEMDYYNNAVGIVAALNCEGCDAAGVRAKVESQINNHAGRRYVGTGLPANKLSPTDDKDLDHD